MNEPDPFEQKTTATIAEAFDVMVEASGIVKRNADYLTRVLRSFYVKALKPMAFIVAGMLMIMVLQQLSLINRDDKVDELNDTVTVLDADVKKMERAANDAKQAAADAEAASLEAKTASEAAKVSLEEALVQSQRGGVNPEVVEALQRINDIYAACVARGEC